MKGSCCSASIALYFVDQVQFYTFTLRIDLQCIVLFCVILIFERKRARFFVLKSRHKLMILWTICVVTITRLLYVCFTLCSYNTGVLHCVVITHLCLTLCSYNPLVFDIEIYLPLSPSCQDIQTLTARDKEPHDPPLFASRKPNLHLFPGWMLFVLTLTWFQDVIRVCWHTRGYGGQYPQYATLTCKFASGIDNFCVKKTNGTTVHCYSRSILCV